ncbi:MAG: hypothetical protein KGO53_10700 [Alphaproteobacteria bacterium]|nr:hypothetical protein [Alphaproteobacteria bacterium]
MPGLVVIIAVLGGGIWFFSRVGRLPQDQVRGFTTQVLGYALMAVAALFALRGNLFVAAPVFVAGAGMAGFQQLLPKPRPQATQQTAPPPPSGPMGRDEALAVLGLRSGATREDIMAAHKRLQLANHPDKGGSDYLAAKINQARDILLK